MPNTQDDDIRELEEAYAKLRDESQQLINERTSLESEVRTLRKKVERLDENVNLLKMPPHVRRPRRKRMSHQARPFAPWPDCEFSNTPRTARAGPVAVPWYTDRDRETAEYFESASWGDLPRYRRGRGGYAKQSHSRALVVPSPPRGEGYA